MFNRDGSRENSRDVNGHAEFLAASCKHLPQADLTESEQGSAIKYRGIDFTVKRDRMGALELLSVSIDLGIVPKPKRLAAYRHMASFNLNKGGEENGSLGFNPGTMDRATHCIVFPRVEKLNPLAFANALRALARQALDFRAEYVELPSGSNAHSHFLKLHGVKREVKHG